MSKTTQQLVTRVLQKLTQLQPGEDASADDLSFLTDTWATINANLQAPTMKVSTWVDNAIPERVFEPLAEYVKEYVWQEYKGDRPNNKQYIDAALVSVRNAVALPYSGSTASAEYF